MSIVNGVTSGWFHVEIALLCVNFEVAYIELFWLATRIE
jgi:hypothetical protein